MRNYGGFRKLVPWWLWATWVLTAIAVMTSPALATERLLTLAEAIELALAHSPAVAAAEARLNGAAGRLAEAEAGFLPKLSLSGSYTRLDEVPTYGGMPIPGSSLDNYDLRLVLSQPLYTGGALAAGREAARAGKETAEAQREQARQEAALAVAQAYYGLRTATELKEIARLGLEAAESHAAQVKAAYDAGTVLRTDLLRVQLQVGNARQNLIKAEHGVALARESFLSLVGLEPGTAIRFPELAPPPPLAEDLEVLVSAALARRPELVALRHSAEAARAGIAAAQAQRRPTVAPALVFNWQGSEVGDLDQSWSFTVSASWNLFDAGAAAARIDQAKAGLAEVEQTLRRVEDGIRLEVRQAYQAVREAEEAIPVALANREQARENLELVRLRYEAGLATPVEVTDAQVLLAQADTGYVQAINDHLVALARLAKASGVPVGVN
ncbi:MAG: TolC family protein [Bacillota bacterium]|nr:TolC family protein [Bacillota bacterium]